MTAGEMAKEKRLRAMVGQPCNSCSKAVATLMCKSCDCVLCILCSDDIHDEDAPLASHKSERVELVGNAFSCVRPCVCVCDCVCVCVCLCDCVTVCVFV